MLRDPTFRSRSLDLEIATLDSSSSIFTSLKLETEQQIIHLELFHFQISKHTVKSKSSGTREKCLPNQYDAKDGESGNMRL